MPLLLPFPDTFEDGVEVDAVDVACDGSGLVPLVDLEAPSLAFGGCNGTRVPRGLGLASDVV